MHVLVTGASGGLGPAVVERFLSEGHTVTAVARKWQQTDAPYRRIAADLTLDSGCRSALAETGQVDALVHVLGGFAGGQPVAGTSGEDWDRMMNLNLRSAFLMFRAVVPQMIGRGSGRIIAIGSRAGVEPAAGFSAYGTSKAGLIYLVRTLALELKGTGVTANAVLPSVIDTPANRTAMPSADHSRWVQPASIATVVCWLASVASHDVNGAVIPVYGEA